MRNVSTLLLSLSLLIFGCEFAGGSGINEAFHYKGSMGPYFPRSAFAGLTNDALLVDVFEKHLSSLREPSIYRNDKRKFAVRCLWMSPHKGDELVRIEATDGYAPLVFYKRGSVLDEDTVRLIFSTSRARKRAELAKLTSVIAQEGAESFSNKQDVLSTDGPIWLLEIYDHGRYHAAYRIDPNVGPFTHVCLEAALVADVSIDIR